MFKKNNPPNYLSLKPPTWHINVHPKYIWSKLKKRTLVIPGMVIVIALIVLAHSRNTRAEIAMFYPSSCLGGWQNPEKATGLPELSPESDPSLFNSTNSAILKDTSAEMMAHEDPKTLNPYRTAQEQLADIRKIFSPDKEKLGIIAFELEKV